MNVCHASGGRISRARYRIPSASIDELASALLDNTSFYSYQDDDLAQSDNDVSKSSTSTPSSGDDEISRKLDAILAAPNAPKPSATLLNVSSTPKISPVTPSRGFARVSSAWDRFYTKPPDIGCKNTRSRLQKQHKNDGFARSKPSDCKEQDPALSNLLPINTIEIHLNEGSNLNKKKVQKIVGRRVAHKPTAQNGAYLRCNQFPNVLCIRPNHANGPDTVGCQPSLMIEKDANANTLLSKSPFESEKGFKNDLEDRILSTLPLGSSTPKTRARSTHFGEHNTIDSIGSKSTQQRKLTFALPQPMQESQSRQDQMKVPELQELNNMERRCRTTTLQSRKVTCQMEWGRGKKHPSPSKKALEDLEVAFRRYTKLRQCGSNDGLDELASLHSTPTTITPRDKTRLKERRLTDLNNKAPRSLSRSRLSRPASVSMECSPLIRLAPAYRPVGFHGDETDELQ